MAIDVLRKGSGVRIWAGFAWIPALSLLTQLALAQTPTLKTRSKEDREEFQAATHRVTLNVQVTDSDGHPVSDLGAGDFTIFDNQQPRKLASFHPIDGAAMYDATRVMILLDAVNSPASALDAEKDGVFRFLAQSKRPFSYPTSFVLWFNGHLEATPLTTDRNSVGRGFVKLIKGLHSNACGDALPTGTEQRTAIRSGEGSAEPATCRAVHFRDSIAALEGIAQQQQSGGGRTLLIWVGAGWPLLTDSEVQSLSPKDQRSYTQAVVSLAHDLRAGQVTLYSVSSSRESSTADAISSASGGGSSSDHPAGQAPSALARKLALPELSRRTGGRVTAASTDIPADIANCIRDADWYYSVSFNAPPAQNGPGELHLLAIKVNRPGLQVRTMTAYYAEP